MSINLFYPGILAGLILFSTLGAGQRGEGFSYSGWSGGAFEWPERAKQEGYSAQALDGSYLETIRLDSLFVPEQSSQALWGNSTLQHSWCTELYSTLEIRSNGCYELVLSSDDGSILWLDSLLVVDNDGLHKWRTRVDTVFLASGTYQARLWYFSRLSPSCGLTLTQRQLPNLSGCRALAKTRAATSITLNTSALFASGEHQLLGSAESSLDALCDSLESFQFTKLTLVGHTDSLGRAYANLLLSKRRAGSVLAHLRSCLDLTDVQVVVDGFGASQPVQPNDTAEGRAANRRVEIFVE